jgi:hypothetical protein
LDDGDRLVNLKEEQNFIEQYVQLRNRYCDLLITNSVNTVETREWLKGEDTEIRCIVHDNLLLGVVILYLKRKGEIALFSRIKHSGFGGKLLSMIEIVAKERGLQEVWAWVLCDNVVAQRTFLKNGYKKSVNSTKIYRDQIMQGFIFRKKLCKDDKK